MSMYKNDINVSLNIGANTQQAQQQIQALQQSLNKLSSAGFGANATKTMKEAAAAAQQLQMHLQKAYNTKTGNLDLGLLNKSLTSANTDISKLSTSLINAGQDGRAAFTNLARSIASANQPMLKTNTLLNNMWTTLKNTARWQISSSILQGFMGSVQKAYTYAQDLNKSLTDIRIVTGHSTEYMKDFAVEANKAAKALSTTTNEYAKASLIYFQQGLNDQQVKERTDVTVKMANVTRESAQTVSDQMTAIWNNFDDGSKSLEYYADVITALGAATASSTDEISQGLEKFAAVAETVGLSYEYATAALATITAETRQSADVVGTALKTLFARIQGLSLGETLDDGTDLNKYSEALAKVGISIKEQNGELKDMDTILNEMAAKWETLNEDQQVALAQTVAGVRQYTQLVALMENWDSMEVNLDVAYNSEGTLQEQADIYAESWEAASKRAKAALEEIYTILLDDSFFIKLTNGFADLIGGIGDFTKGIGGLKGILLTIVGIFLTNFAHKIPQAVEGVRYNLSVLFKGAAKEAEKMTGKFNEMLTASLNNSNLSDIQKQQIKYSQQLLQAKSQLAKITSTMTDAERFQAESAIAQLEAQQQEVDELYNKIETLKNSTQGSLQGAVGDITDKIERSFQNKEAKKTLGTLDSHQYDALYNANNAMIKNLANAYSNLKNDANSMLEGIKISKIASEQKSHIDKLAGSIKSVGFKEAKREGVAFAKSLEKLIPKNMENEANKLKTIIKSIREAPKEGNGLETALRSLSKFMDETSIKGKDLKNILSQMDIPDNIINDLSQMGLLERKAANGAKNIEEAFKQLQNTIKHTPTALEQITKSIGGFSSIAMGINSLKSAFDTFNNPDVSGIEKWSSILMSLSMGISMLTTGCKSLKGVYIDLIGASAARALSLAVEGKSLKELNEEQVKNIIIDKLGVDSDTAAIIISELSTGKTLKQILAEKGLNIALEKQIALVWQSIAAWIVANPLIAVAAATIAILAAAILLTAKNSETLEEKLKRQSEELEKVTEQADKAREAFEKLKETITSYDEATKALEKLEKGTEEYTEKLKEANAAARELIETFGINEGITYENGQIIISEESLNNAKEQYDDSNDSLTYWEYQKSNERNETQNQIKIETLTEEKLQSPIYDEIGFMGNLFRKSYSQQLARHYSELYNELEETGDLTSEEINKIMGNNDFGAYSSYITDLIEKLSPQFKSLSSSLDELSDSAEDDTAKILAASQILEGEEFFDNSEFQATLINSYMEAAEKAYDIAKAQLDEEIIDLQDAEARMIEAGFDKIVDENGKEVWEGPNGQIVTNDIETIKEYLASIVADKEGKGASQDEAKQMAKLAQINPELAAFIDQQNDGSQMSYTDQLALKKQFENGQFFTDQNDYAVSQGFKNYEDMKFAAHYGGTEAQKALQEESAYVIDQNTYDDIAALNPYADLEKAYETSFTGDMALGEKVMYGDDGKRIEIPIGANFNIDAETLANDPEWIQAKEMFENATEEEKQILVSGRIDFSADKEDIKNQVNEILNEQKVDEIFARTAEATGWSEEAVRSYADSLKALYPELQKNSLAAAKAAEAHLNFAKGAQDASEILKEQAAVLNEANSESMEYHEAIGKLTTALNQMFGTKVDTNFLKIEKNMANLKKAVKGDIQAIEELRKALAKDFVVRLEAEGYKEAAQGVQQLMDALAAAEAKGDIQVGIAVDDTAVDAAIDNLNSLAQQGKITADQINDALATMGYTADLSYETDTMTVPGTTQRVSGLINAQNIGSHGQVLSESSTRYSGSIEYSDYEYSYPVIDKDSLTKLSTPKSLGSAAKSNPAPKSSGGGGGSDKGEDLLDPKNYEDEIERYHETTRALERLTRALEKVTTAKDRAFGKERLRLIEEEIAATEKLVAEQKQYLAEIEAYMAIDRSRMEQYGFTFDANGEITNYNEIYKQQVDKFNASRTEEAEEEYDKFKETVEQYEETLTLLDEEQMKYQEYLNSIVDLKLEKITTEVEVKIRVNDIELTKLEYMLKKLQREGSAAADEIKNIADQINETMEKAGPIQEAIDKIYEQARAEGRGLTAEETAEIQSFYADGVIDAREQERVNAIYAKADAEDRMLTQAEEDQIQEYKEQLLELNEEVWDLADAIENKLIEELDEFGAEFDEDINRLTTYTQMYENLQDVITLTGKGKTAEGLNALNQLAASSLKNSTNALKANKANYDTFVELAAEANRHLDEAIAMGDQHMIDYWTEQVEEVTVRMEEAHVAMLESFNDALEAAGDLFDTKVENMITKLKKDLGDLDTMIELYDRAVELENLYLSSNQSIYELSKLTRDIGKSIEDTSNIIAKNKLADLMKEINKLRAEGVKLSKYDLEYLQAKYELELAEIALQEAQEAKSTVKLTRDNEGGWGYVYTADSEKLDEAAQNFEDKLYNMQQLNAEYINSYSEALLKNRQEMLDALAAIDKAREDYDEEVARVRADYMAKEEFYIAELTKAYERQGVTYEETILGMISNDESLLESHENFSERTAEIIEKELIPAHQEWLENVQDICEEAGYSYDELTEGVLENIENISQDSEKLTDQVLQEQEDMRTSMAETMQSIQEWQKQYCAAIEEMIAANEDYYQRTINDYTNAMQQIVDTAVQAANTITNLGTETVGGLALEAGGGEDNPDTGAPGPNSFDVVGADGTVIASFAGTDEGLKAAQEYKKQQTMKAETELRDLVEGKGTSAQQTPQAQAALKEYTNIKNSQVIGSGLATGGYTGSWGPEGRWAMLHEKELVLNKHDTKNMLDMVNTLRDIDWRAKLSELWTNIEEKFITPIFGGADELLQNVQIEASFPNVVEHSEIEEAFNNLINTASQYANRKLF